MENKVKKAKVDYAAIIREFEMYGRGRSLRQFCDESNYTYANVLHYYRKCFWDSKAKSGDSSKGDNTLVPLEIESVERKVPISSSVGTDNIENSTSSANPPVPTYSIVSMHVSFSNGMELSLRDTDVDEITALLHKIVG